jgi:hypothetical protein
MPHPNEGRLLFEPEDLALTIDLILEGDEHAALLLAQLFVSFRQAIDSGLHGINQTGSGRLNRVDLPTLSGTSGCAQSLPFVSRRRTQGRGRTVRNNQRRDRKNNISNPPAQTIQPSG